MEFHGNITIRGILLRFPLHLPEGSMLGFGTRSKGHPGHPGLWAEFCTISTCAIMTQAAAGSTSILA